MTPEFLELAYEVMCGAVEPTKQQMRQIACAAYLNGLECIENRLFFREGINPYRPVIRKNP